MSRAHLSPEAVLLRPGITSGFYPERSQKTDSWLQDVAHALTGIIKTVTVSEKRLRQNLAAIHEHGRKFEKLNDAALRKKIRNIRVQLHQEGMTQELTRQAFALVRETAGRKVNMRHFDTQLMGGWIMVHGGLAEMDTGEGKTLTATLAAATAALAGIPVHIVTVNDYLVTRDAELMGPIYRAMGLSVSTVTGEMGPADRITAYTCNITYCTNKQLAFDYLRDRIILGNDQGRRRLQLERLHNENARTERLFLRGLCFAIIDEADSVLIDEARTPLVISRKSDSTDEDQTYLQAMNIAQKLQSDIDFSLDQKERRVQLTEEGSIRVADAAKLLGGIWNGIRRSEELVCHALSAKYLFLRDQHYLVHDDKVMIIDENTGRTMADRSWEHGLHQMIEIKENCEVTGRNEHMARLTYQRFFRRYLRLAGMTGTAREVRRELWSTYRLPVVKVAPHKPCLRKDAGQQVFATKNEKWDAVIRHIRKINLQGRPILVGTRSVADSEYLSRLLHDKGLPHQTLNARQDSGEAEIISRAGQQGFITVATNMAGRGTDISLGAGVAEIGGLHIIATERNEAGRIDRQLYGRCGRQGDPGSYESILSIEDEILQNYLSDSIRNFFVRLIHTGQIVSQRMSLFVIRQAQSATERRYLRMRRDLLQMDEQLGSYSRSVGGWNKQLEFERI